MMPSIHQGRLEAARDAGEALVIAHAEDGPGYVLRPDAWGSEAIARSPSRTALALVCRRHGLELDGIDRIL